MTARANHFKLGLFVLLGTFLLVGGLIAFGIGTVFERRVQFETYHDETVQGLTVGSQVKYRGVTLGSVEEIGYCRQYYGDVNGASEKTLRYVYVRFSLDPDQIPNTAGGVELAVEVARLVRDGLRVKLASLGLTGSLYLELDFVDPLEHEALPISWTPESLHIPSTPSRLVEIARGIEAFVNTFDTIDAGAVVANVDSLVTELRARVAELDLPKLQAGVSDTLASARARLDDPELAELPKDLRAFLAQAQPDIEEALEGIANASEELRGLGADARDVFTKDVATALPRVLENLESTLANMNAIVEGRAIDVEVLVRNLRQVSSDLRDLTNLVKRQPSQLLFGDPPPPRESNR